MKATIIIEVDFPEYTDTWEPDFIADRIDAMLQHFDANAEKIDILAGHSPYTIPH